MPALYRLVCTACRAVYSDLHMDTDTIRFNALDNKRMFKGGKPPLNALTDWLPQPLRLIAEVVVLLLLAIVVFSTPIVLLIIISIAFVFYIWLGTALVALVVLGLILLYRRQRRIDRANNKNGLKDFARQNGWTYGPASKLIQQFNNGQFVKSATENQVTLYSVAGKFQDHEFELLTGWKASKYGPLEPLTPELFIRSNSRMPTAVLVSRQVTDGSGVFDRMFVSYREPTALSLEGDFDKFFQLYIPKGGQVNALSLIAPDFMQTVVSFSGMFTIEMSHDTFALLPAYAEKLTKKTAEDMFEAASKILTETDC